MNLIRSDADRILYYCENPKVIAQVHGHTFHDETLAELARQARGFTSYYTPRKVTTITSSGTDTPTFGGIYRIRSVGAGGGGGAGAASAGGADVASGGGGGAAGASIESFQTLVGGTGYTATIGAAGAGGTGGSAFGGNGTSGGDTIYAGVSTVHAPGGGYGQGGTLQVLMDSASIVDNVISFSVNTNPGQVSVGSTIVTTGITGGTNWSSVNSQPLTVVYVNGAGTQINVLFGQVGSQPSSTPTGFTGNIYVAYINGGVYGANTDSVNSYEFGPGFGGPSVFISTIWQPTVGSGPFGLASGGGGAGGSNTASANGGTGGSAGTTSAGGGAGSNGANSTAAGTVGAAGAANSGAGGGGGGATTGVGTGAAGGAGGTGLIVREGPL